MSLFTDASLVMIPSGYKDQKVYSVTPTDGTGDLTFTRSNDTATRVNSSGLIEKVRTNEVLYSNDFTYAGWANVNVTITPNNTTGPFGEQNATKVELTGAGAYIAQQISVSNPPFITFSIYAKAGTQNIFRLRESYYYGTQVVFDLTTGTIISGTGTIESVGSGWYKVSITQAYTAGQTAINFTYDSTAASGYFFAFGAQYEISDAPTGYIPTLGSAVSVGPVANLPRLDYSGGATCPSLLLEPQRTNSASQSEDFNGWPTKVNVTTTANYAVSPDGYTNADRLVFTSNGYMYPSSGVTQTNGVVYTLSCYAKRNGSGTQSIGFFKDGSGVVDNAWTLTSNWQRFTYTYTAGNASLAGIGGISGADVSVYGFQFEIGAYATSYIPTLSAAVTRGADACSKTGISSLLPSTEGTVFIDADINFDNSNFTILGSTYVNGATMFTNSVYFYINNNKIDGQIWNTPAFTGWTGLSPSLANGRHKFAISWKASDFVYYIDGNLIASSTAYSAVPTGMNRLDIGDYYGSYGTNNKYNQLLIFKTRLSNADLATLTTI
jgi:hypothetical protein